MDLFQRHRVQLHIIASRNGSRSQQQHIINKIVIIIVIVSIDNDHLQVVVKCLLPFISCCCCCRVCYKQKSFLKFNEAREQTTTINNERYYTQVAGISKTLQQTNLVSNYKNA